MYETNNSTNSEQVGLPVAPMLLFSSALLFGSKGISATYLPVKLKENMKTVKLFILLNSHK